MRKLVSEIEPKTCRSQHFCARESLYGSVDRVVPAAIDKITAWMTADAATEEIFPPHLKYLQQVVPLARQEESAIFGEALPAGLVLHT